MALDKKILYQDVEKPGFKYPPTVTKEIEIRYSLAIQVARSKDILEVGFGAGHGIKNLITICKSYHGIDYLEDNVNYVKQKFNSLIKTEVKIEQGDAHFLNIIDSSKDLVIAFAVIYYLDLKLFLNECHRVLRGEGTLIFCQTNPDCVNFNPSRNTINYYSYKQLKIKLKEFGFESKIYGICENDLTSKKFVLIKNLIKTIPFMNLIILNFKKIFLFKKLADKLEINSSLKDLDKLMEINENSKKKVRILYVFAKKIV